MQQQENRVSRFWFSTLDALIAKSLMSSNVHSLVCIIWLVALAAVESRIHHLALRDDARRNILLTTFGYNVGGTFELNLHDFVVPEELVSTDVVRELRNTDRFGVIGFTFSRDKEVLNGIRSKPHVCQLSQQDQGFNAIFFFFNFTQNTLNIVRTGSMDSLELCKDLNSCKGRSSTESSKVPLDDVPKKNASTKASYVSVFGKLQNMFFPATNNGVAYQNYIPLILNESRYSASLAIRFADGEQGSYSFIYHNCFNYRARGFLNQVAVDFTIDIIERNPDSFLPAGDIEKPKFYLYMAMLFAITACIWTRKIIRSSTGTVYRVHHLMTALVILKSLSLFFHGINYYFVAVYGHQQEVWAVVYYITHLLKGALLFGTIILIGTGYTFFKNFLTDRDRKLFLIVIPLQVIDNVAMIIIEESEFGQQGYQFWFQVFIFFDIVCCLAIIIPVIWSMRHLQEGARSDGKAAFNLEKLKLFRHFYLIVISYIYATRVIKFIVEEVVPFNYEWISAAVVEISTLIFFVIAGYQFRPQEKNPYIKLAQEDDAEALTVSGVFANISRLKRISVRDETLNDIPGMIGGDDLNVNDSDTDEIFANEASRPLTKSLL